MTALAVFISIIISFSAGYYVGKGNTNNNDNNTSSGGGSSSSNSDVEVK